MRVSRGPLEPTSSDTGRWLALVAAVVMVVALQIGGLRHIRMFGVYPELMVVVVCSVALHRGPVIGVVAGLFLGLIVDLPGGHLIGLSAIGYAAAGLIAGILGARVFPERWLVVGTAVALGTVASQVVYAAGAHAFGFPLSLWEAGPRIVGPLVAYHLLLTPLVYPLTRYMTETCMPRGLDA